MASPVAPCIRPAPRLGRRGRPVTVAAGEGEEEKSEEQESEEARGFVPLAELHFVLPDQMVQPQQPRTATGQQRTGQMAQRGQPQQGGMTQQTGMAQQQQMQQPSSSPQQTNR